MSELPRAAISEDLERTIRVSDQSCTAHAVLRDRYRRRSTGLDLAILLTSGWLVATVWIQPSIADRLTPIYISREIWLGLLSLFTFGLSLVQLQVNWKERANSHHQALTTLSTYVKELRVLRGATDVPRISAALERYQAITEPLQPIPEADFLQLKKRHLLKVAASKHLDAYPGTSLFLFRLALLLRHNAELLHRNRKQGSDSK
jgi:hypothetical protein